jgi:hypothetical protein
VECRVRQGRVILTLRSVSEPVVELWDARRKAGLFEKAFDVELGLKWAPPREAAPKLELVRERQAG